jgi:hypothetical protein
LLLLFLRLQQQLPNRQPLTSSRALWSRQQLLLLLLLLQL